MKPIKTEFITKLKPIRVTKPKIGTFDIETIVNNGKHKPYLYSFYDGKNSYSCFSDNASSLFSKILTRKYRNYTFYAHNLSRFDIVFLFKDIADLKSKGFNINILKKEDKIISIKIISNDKNISITLKDSILLLPMSLAKLSKQFNLQIGKLIEPVYTGNDSLHQEYKMSDLSHYSKEIDKIDNFEVWKDAIAKYCIQDSIALY